MAMRLQTPEKIRTLQRKLYLKAKAEPDFRTSMSACGIFGMKPVGKPDAGNSHVRFDERGRETE